MISFILMKFICFCWLATSFVFQYQDDSNSSWLISSLRIVSNMTTRKRTAKRCCWQEGELEAFREIMVQLNPESWYSHLVMQYSSEWSPKYSWMRIFGSGLRFLHFPKANSNEWYNTSNDQDIRTQFHSTVSHHQLRWSERLWKME